MKYSLDQRRYRLNISNKQLYDECKSRGRKISYATVLNVINHPGEADCKNEELVEEVVSELETEKGITDIYFDKR